jgi:hypothetical protein
MMKMEVKKEAKMKLPEGEKTAMKMETKVMKGKVMKGKEMVEEMARKPHLSTEGTTRACSMMFDQRTLKTRFRHHVISLYSR